MPIQNSIRIIYHRADGSIDKSEQPIRMTVIPRQGDYIQEYKKELLVTKVVWNIENSYYSDSSYTTVDVHVIE